MCDEHIFFDAEQIQSNVGNILDGASKKKKKINYIINNLYTNRISVVVEVLNIKHCIAVYKKFMNSKMRQSVILNHIFFDCPSF